MDLPLPSIAAIKTYEPAILFAVLYALLVLLYVWKTAHNPAYAFIVLVIFCICKPLFSTVDRQVLLRAKTVRVVGFILRAILATSEGAKENDGLVIAETIFFSLGYVGLLYSVFLLTMDRSILPSFRS